MNPNEAELTYPWSEIPATGAVRPLRDGIGWVRMALPFALDHINLWLLDDLDPATGAAGFTVVDCGLGNEATQVAWEQIFDTYFGGRRLRRVLATHFHPDHLGASAWLTQGGARRRWQVPLWMTLGEYMTGRVFSGSDDRDDKHDGAAADPGLRAAAHVAANGLTDPDQLAQVAARGRGYYRSLVPAVPPAFVRIHDGDEIVVGAGPTMRAWRVIVGHGHAPEHACLFDAAGRVLIAGDMVLPRISTNVSVFETEPEADPLPRYLRSLERLRALPADTLVLPSHGLPFIGLHQRIAQQLAHHAARLAEVQAACNAPRSAADIVPVLFKRALDLHQLTFALGEALAHLHMLWHAGSLRRRRDDDGVYRFVRAGSASVTPTTLTTTTLTTTT